MKKFNKVSLIVVMLIIVALCAMTIVACDHQHNYSEWGNDADGHWKYCPADNEIDESSKAAHSFDSDGKCECGYEKPSVNPDPSEHTHSYDANGDCSCGDHQHVWAAEYSRDDNGHWIACVKAGCDGKKEEGSHAYDESREGCICGIHMHKYAESWSWDETSHWHDCISSECQDKSDEATHNDTDNDEICDACGYNMHVHEFTLSDIQLPYYDDEWNESIGEYDLTLVDGSAHIKCAKESCIDKDIAIKMIPIDSEINKSDASEEEYYAIFPDWNIFNGMPSGLIFSSGDSTSIEMIYIRDDDYEWSEYQENIPDGTYMFNGMSAAIVMISSSDGNISFEVNQLPGTSSSNPIAINKDQQYKGNISGDLWFSYEAEEGGQLLIINHSAANDISFYIGSDMCMDEYNIYEVSAGSKYSIKLYGYGEYDIKLMDYSSDYIGYSYSDPIIMSGNSYSASNASGDRYYKYVAQSSGRPSISIDQAGVSYSLHYMESGYLYQHYSLPKLSEGDELYIKVYAGDVASYGLSVNVSNDQPFDHTFIIKDGSNRALSGVTVSVNGQSGETDSNGQVILSLVPGEYEISISGYDTTQLFYNATSTNDEDLEYNIRLGELKSNKFIVVDADGNPIEGVKVLLRQGSNSYGNVAAFGITDENGTVTINYAKVTSKMYVDIEGSDYEVSSLSAEGLNPGQQYFSVSSFAGKDMTLTLSAKAAEPQGNFLVIGNNNISIEEFSNGWAVAQEYTFTSAEGGDYVLSFDKSQYQYVEVLIGKFNSVLYYYLSSDEGYEDEYQDSYEFHLDPGGSITFKMNTLSESPDQYVINLAYATVDELSLGDNYISASYSGKEITFTSEEGGKFILSSDDRQSYIYVVGDEGEEYVCSKGDNYKFSLNAGGSITFIMCLYDYSTVDKAYYVNIAIDNSSSSEPSEPSEPVGNVLVLGENTVTGSFIGTEYTFTASASGTYVVTSNEANYCLIDTKTNVMYFKESSVPYSFTINEGDNITLTLSTASFTEDSSTYKINIALAPAESEAE